jgi:mono/diheme cytochrome c family protein
VGAAALIVALTAGLGAQAPAPSIGPRPNAGPPDRPPVDPVAADRGRALYGVECITCHGSTARGTAEAPSLVRSLTVLNDRYGTLLGPFFAAGHAMQSGRSSVELTGTAVVDLMHFLRQRVNDTLRGSPVFTVQDILTGDPKAGQAYFSGAGGCTACHSATGDLAGLASRLAAPVDIQQRMLFPPRRLVGAAASRTAVTVTVTGVGPSPVTGTLVLEDDFFVTVREPEGRVRTMRKGPDVSIVKADPLQAHHDLLDRLTDQHMHDLTAYLVSLK